MVRQSRLSITTRTALNVSCTHRAPHNLFQPFLTLVVSSLPFFFSTQLFCGGMANDYLALAKKVLEMLGKTLSEYPMLSQIRWPAGVLCSCTAMPRSLGTTFTTFYFLVLQSKNVDAPPPSPRTSTGGKMEHPCNIFWKLHSATFTLC